MKKIVITCEHGGNDIPTDYLYLFKGEQDILNSHYGWDIGALDVANQLTNNFADFFFYSTISRLLVDLNRSLGHPKLFSSFTKSLDSQAKEQILENYYFPYRNELEQTIFQKIQRGNTVLHLSIHSFTPIFEDRIRNVDIGLLYDPIKSKEKEFCQKWKRVLLKLDKNLQVKSNQPYLGKSDGFVTYLRKKFADHSYVGIELEMNQKFFMTHDSETYLTNLLISSLQVIFNNLR